MNHWERLTAALRSEPLDRLPVALWRQWPEVDHDPVALARAVMQWQRRFDFDLTVYTAPPTCVAEHFGALTAYRGEPYGCRQVDRLRIAHPRQWLDLRPAPNASNVLVDLNAGLRRVADALGGTVPLIQSIPSPLTTAWHLAGDELIEHMRSAADSVETGLRAIAASTVDFAHGALDSGASGIRWVAHVPASANVTRDGYRRFGRRFDLEVLDSIGAGPPWNVLEFDGPRTWCDDFVDYPVQILAWGDRTGDPGSMADSPSFPGIVATGIDAQGPLVQGTRSDCFDATVAAIARLGRSRAMIATGGACRVDTNEGNIDALIDAVKRPAQATDEEERSR